MKERTHNILVTVAMGIVFLSLMLVMGVMVVMQTPEQICASQVHQTDFCRALVTNPNFTLKK